MDKLKAFIQTMTFWNWLTLALTPVALLGGLNAFFNLRSRWKDWRGTQTKKNFETRLKQLKEELFLVQASRTVLPTFFLYVLNEALVIAGVTLATLPLLVGAFIMYRLPFNLRVFEVFYLVLALAALLYAGSNLKKLTVFVGKVYDPKKLGKEILDFIHVGRKKGFIENTPDFVLSLLKNDDLFGESGKIQLASHADTLERKLPADKRDNSLLI